MVLVDRQEKYALTGFETDSAFYSTLDHHTYSTSYSPNYSIFNSNIQIYSIFNSIQLNQFYCVDSQSVYTTVWVGCGRVGGGGVVFSEDCV